MKIGIDIRNVTMGRATGAGQLALHCYRALTQCDKGNAYLPYHDALGRFGQRGKLAAAVAGAIADLVSKQVWIPIWARCQKIDLLLFLLPPCSFMESSIPQLCYILDIPQPWDNNRLDYTIYNDIYIRRSCQKADNILTISNFSADQIAAVYHVPRDRIHVIYPCIDLNVFRPCQEDCHVLKDRLAQSGVSPGYLLGVISRLIPRKNPAAYLEVYSRLPVALRRERKLVLAGGGRTLEDFRIIAGEALFNAVREDVMVLGRVSDGDLARLYTMAGALLFPSWYEGFGLPVVEALACGTDVIASDIPAVREASSSSVFLCDPNDLDGMARCFERIGSDPQSVETRRRVASDWVQRFSYQAYANAFAGVLKKIS